jgi:hypothetical protein
MKGNPEFHKASKISKSSFVQRYSEKARRVTAAAIETDGMANLWAAAKASGHRIASAYRVNGVNVRRSSAATAGAVQ